MNLVSICMFVKKLSYTSSLVVTGTMPEIVNLIMGVSVLLFSNFKKINWLLTKLYMDVFRDANQLISINNRIIPSQCDPIIDCSTCIIWLQLCDHNGCNRPVKDPDIIPKGKKFIAKCYGPNQLSPSEHRCTIWKNKTIHNSVQKS